MWERRVIEQDLRAPRGWHQSTDAGLSCVGSAISTSSTYADTNLFASVCKWEESLPAPDHLPSPSECLLQLSDGFTGSEEWSENSGPGHTGNMRRCRWTLQDRHCGQAVCCCFPPAAQPPCWGTSTDSELVRVVT